MTNKSENLIDYLPQTIKVACFDYKIVKWTYQQASEKRRYGECSSYTQEIRIDETLKSYKLLDTLIHEINHAIYWAYNIQDEDMEERIVTSFATAWTQIYRDNINLLKFIERARK